MAKAKPVIKAAALDKTISTATESLSKACGEATTAVAVKSAEAKNLLADVKRHLKKKTILTKRSKTAAAKLKKESNAVNRKAVAAVTKELKATNAALNKARTSKAAVLTELAALKSASKRLTAYTRSISALDKVLNKPAKKRIKKKAAK
jgi:hypothetical protein